MNRIQYVDAMRGFTMFLVVLGHVSTFGLGLYGTETFFYHSIANLFQMPLFFFISGFVLYKKGFEWSFANTFAFLKKKLVVLILSPFIFMVAYVVTTNGSLVAALYDYTKAGYWFTFALFEYFCFYILAQQLVRLFKLKGLSEDILLLVLGGAIYVVTVFSNVMACEWDKGWPALIGVPTWHNIIFFVIGTRIRKYFREFETLLETKWFVLISVSIFFLFNLFPQPKMVSNTLWNFLTASTGIVMVFAFFRQYQDSFDNAHRIGRWIQFVGRRTLDIYLIHYFFLFSNMQAVLPNFGQLNSPFLEFVLSTTIALLIIGCCLGVSCVLRLSPVMAHFLFGQKNSVQTNNNVRK